MWHGNCFSNVAFKGLTTEAIKDLVLREDCNNQIHSLLIACLSRALQIYGFETGTLSHTIVLENIRKCHDHMISMWKLGLFCLVSYKLSLDKCKTVVSPGLMPWSYTSLALSQWYWRCMLKPFHLFKYLPFTYMGPNLIAKWAIYSHTMSAMPSTGTMPANHN